MQINENKQTKKIFFYFLDQTRIDLGPIYLHTGKSRFM